MGWPIRLPSRSRQQGTGYGGQRHAERQIMVPLVGDVQAAGLTAAELTARLTEEFSEEGEDLAGDRGTARGQ